MNEEALPHWGMSRKKKRNKEIIAYDEIPILFHPLL
jgi:hypothetical protein